MQADGQLRLICYLNLDLGENVRSHCKSSRIDYFVPSVTSSSILHRSHIEPAVPDNAVRRAKVTEFRPGLTPLPA